MCDVHSAAFAVSIPPLQNRVMPLPSMSVPCPTTVHLTISPPRGRTAIANLKVSKMSLLQIPIMFPPLCFRVLPKCLNPSQSILHSQACAPKVNPARTDHHIDPPLLKPCLNWPSLSTFRFVTDPSPAPPMSILRSQACACEMLLRLAVVLEVR